MDLMDLVDRQHSASESVKDLMDLKHRPGQLRVSLSVRR